MTALDPEDEIRTKVISRILLTFTMDFLTNYSSLKASGYVKMMMSRLPPGMECALDPLSSELTSYHQNFGWFNSKCPYPGFYTCLPPIRTSPLS